MAKRQTDLDIEVENAMQGWQAINRQEDKMEWEAWTRWRREHAGARAEPDNLTVPTPFPPMTIIAARDYLDVIRKARLAIGWKRGADRISKDPSSYMGGKAA